jgi:hypothetical protein
MELPPFDVKNVIAKDELHCRSPERTVVEGIFKSISRVIQAAVKVFAALSRDHGPPTGKPNHGAA